MLALGQSLFIGVAAGLPLPTGSFGLLQNGSGLFPGGSLHGVTHPLLLARQPLNVLQILGGGLFGGLEHPVQHQRGFGQRTGPVNGDLSLFQTALRFGQLVFQFLYPLGLADEQLQQLGAAQFSQISVFHRFAILSQSVRKHRTASRCRLP